MVARKTICMPRTISVSRTADTFSRIVISSNTRRDLVQNVNRHVMLDCKHHGFENVDVPAIRDAYPKRVARLRNQPSAQRNSKIACNDPENHRLPHPVCVSTFHRVFPFWISYFVNKGILRVGYNRANGTWDQTSW